MAIGAESDRGFRNPVNPWLYYPKPSPTSVASLVRLMTFLRPTFAVLTCLAILAGAPASAAEPAPSYYLIGNSLTWDTVPSLLDGDVQWHVDCGKSLPYILEHPEEPCVKTSTLWPQALKAKQYDYLSVQTHYGATLAEDAGVISTWLKMQPKAVLIVHSGWAHHAKRAEEYASTDTTGRMQHSPAYVSALIAQLRKQHPDREIRQTHAIDLLDRIAADVKAGKAPFKEVAELHRDKIHVTIDNGRYLMHNAMRRALRQPASNRGFEKIDPEIKTYLDRVLAGLER